MVFILFIYTFWDSICIPGWPWTLYIDGHSFGCLSPLLPPLPEWEDFRCPLPSGWCSAGDWSQDFLHTSTSCWLSYTPSTRDTSKFFISSLRIWYNVFLMTFTPSFQIIAHAHFPIHSALCAKNKTKTKNTQPQTSQTKNHQGQCVPLKCSWMPGLPLEFGWLQSSTLREKTLPLPAANNYQ